MTKEIIKAKEHYSLYLLEKEAAGEKTATYSLGLRFCDEVYSLAKARGVARGRISGGSVRGIFREIGQKWRAVCKMDSDLDPKGLRPLMMKVFPDFILYMEGL